MMQLLESLLSDAKLLDHAASVVIVSQGLAVVGGVLVHGPVRRIVVHHTTRAQRAVRRSARRHARAVILHLLDESRDPKPPVKKAANDNPTINV